MINCEDAGVVEHKVQEKIHNVVVTKTQVPKSQKSRKLLKFKKLVKTGTQGDHIDSAILFIYLIILIERYEDPVSYPV